MRVGSSFDSLSAAAMVAARNGSTLPVFYSGMSAKEVIATLAIASAVGCSLVADQARTANVQAD